MTRPGASSGTKGPVGSALTSTSGTCCGQTLGGIVAGADHTRHSPSPSSGRILELALICVRRPVTSARREAS